LHWASGRSSEPILADVGLNGLTASEINRPIANVATEQRAKRSRIVSMRSAVAAAIAMAALVAGIALFLRPQQAGHVENRPGLPSAAAGAIVVAELRSGEGCKWTSSDHELAAGEKLFSGQQLELATGVARFSFVKGATVLIESPAKLELVS